jgi:hypothetical protein
VVWYGTVPGLRIGNVDDLERNLVYGVGMWTTWKGAWSTF